jgi:hypothetical protein
MFYSINSAAIVEMCTDKNRMYFSVDCSSIGSGSYERVSAIGNAHMVSSIDDNRLSNVMINVRSLY